MLYNPIRTIFYTLAVLVTVTLLPQIARYIIRIMEEESPPAPPATTDPSPALSLDVGSIGTIVASALVILVGLVAVILGIAHLVDKRTVHRVVEPTGPAARLKPAEPTRPAAPIAPSDTFEQPPFLPCVHTCDGLDHAEWMTIYESCSCRCSTCSDAGATPIGQASSQQDHHGAH